MDLVDGLLKLINCCDWAYLKKTSSKVVYTVIIFMFKGYLKIVHKYLIIKCQANFFAI
jgi:hypothetical protein